MLPFCHSESPACYGDCHSTHNLSHSHERARSKGWNVVKFHQSVLYLWRDEGHKSVLAGRKYDSITKMSGSRAWKYGVYVAVQFGGRNSVYRYFMSRARDAVRFHCRVHHRAGITSIVGISMAGDRSEFVPIPDNFFTGKDCRNVTKICSHSRSCRSFLVCHTEVWNYVVFKFLYFTLERRKKNADKEMMNESRAEKI